jgi:tannase/feruloyl esterase
MRPTNCLNAFWTAAASVLLGLSGCGGGGDDSPPAQAQPLSLKEKCPTLTGVALDATTTITSASVISGSFTPPGTTTPLTDVPESCRIVGVAKPVPDSNINFEVWLPISNWNEKFMSASEAGFAGLITWGELKKNVLRGYATAGTDMGHVDPTTVGGDWIVGHPERVKDWGYRGKHVTTVAAKAAIEQFFGMAPKKSYYVGCSGGGHEGMLELQRYPDDFDGYVIGAPASDWTGQTTRWAWENRVFADAASQIPNDKLPALQAATLAQCDAVDGVKDGIISNPRACTFNPDVLLCPAGTDTNACLTTPQLTALKKVYQGPRDSANRQLFPGNEIGAETSLNARGAANWPSFVTGPFIRMTLGLFTYGRMLHNVTDWDPMRFSFDTDPDLMRAVLGPDINATDADLRVQKAKGIKILHYHGWADGALSPQASISYYEAVAAQVGGIDKAQEFYKLYMVPGMVHCAGGPGPNHIGNEDYPYNPNATAKDDLVKALEQWVEKGQAPDTITATKYTNDNITSPVIMKRPVCPWPKVQKYVSGDPNVESSFVCSAP